MPRFLLDAAAPESALHRLRDLAAHRFPEVALEQHFTDHAGTTDMWVCRAPSCTHVQRWADAAGLQVQAIRRVDAVTDPHEEDQ
jgi:hypothetical protein